jgi:hypothetical protein
VNTSALDFIDVPGNRASRIWLVLGGALLATAVVHFQRLSNELDDARHDWETRTQEKSRTARAPVHAEQNPTLQAAIKGLSLNWEPLFNAVEGATKPKVALLTLEPDASRGSVRLNLEAKDKQAMMEYLAGLAAQPGLANVSLMNEATQLENPQQPVRFSVGATWRP